MKDGGPAFPTNTERQYRGMTLRDWFAGMAMNGLLSDPTNQRDMDTEDFAQASYEMADAMIAERDKEKK